MARTFIGVPTLNRPQLVKLTVDSVRAQTDGNWLLVVSDNVSEPAAQAEVAQWIESLGDPRVRFHAQPRNDGEYGQGRFFLGQAERLCCDFLAILHDDDLIRPDYVARASALLGQHPEAGYVAPALQIIDDDGQVREDWTRSFDERWGRVGAVEGWIDVLDSHMQWGFTPITGAFFRLSALRDSGFVDADMHGCFPFESNIFLRLGERGGRAWYTTEPLLQLRWHQQQMRHWGFLNQPSIVEQTIRLFERRRFDGLNERRRRQLLGRLQRVWALHCARQGDVTGARQAAWASLGHNPASVRNWLVGGASLLVPGAVGRLVRRTFRPDTYSRA
jgi:hypothetical protein